MNQTKSVHLECGWRLEMMFEMLLMLIFKSDRTHSPPRVNQSLFCQTVLKPVSEKRVSKNVEN